ncbi:MAG TPA: hypothetical protein VGB91_14260 [Rhizomicrobium sp.]
MTMSAIGIASFPRRSTRASTIGAHADFRRTDFIFARTQSHTTRDLPWACRAKPLRCWCEIVTYGAAAFVAAIAALVLV